MNVERPGHEDRPYGARFDASVGRNPELKTSNSKLRRASRPARYNCSGKPTSMICEGVMW